MMNMGQQVSTTDRLSGLPDDVILHILTFLPTKISVRTSVLSKPWRFRWAHVPSLEFTAVDSKMINVMLRHKQNITTFHLSHEPGTKNMLLSTDDFDLEACIASVFARKVRRLHINLNLPLPRCMFTSETLVDLCVLDCSGEVLDCVVRFPSLKKLQLGNVNGDEALPRLLSGCPVLEELIIERMMTTMHGMCCHDVSSSTLTRLVLRLDQEEVALKLDTPALRYLKLRVLGSKNISATALDSLIEAKLNFDGYNTKPGDSFYLRCVTQFLRKLYNVSSLTLLTRRMEVPDSVFSSVSPIKFRNLIKLKLCADWRFISSFLENANNLQVVTFIRTVYHDTQYWMEPKRVPACLISHLRRVSVIGGLGCLIQQEFEMLRYILSNGKALKQMLLNTRVDSKEQIEDLKRLALLARASPARLPRLRLFRKDIKSKFYAQMILLQGK